MDRTLTGLLLVCAVTGLFCGCGSPQSKLLGHWVSTREQGEVIIEKNGDAFTVEIVQNGSSSKFPGTYKDGTLTIQNMWVTVSFYYDDKTGDLVANMGGQEDHLKRK